MGWTVGSFIGPILSGLLKDHFAYYEMSCTLSKCIHDDPNQSFVSSRVNANFSQRHYVLYLVSRRLSASFRRRRPVETTWISSNRKFLHRRSWVESPVLYIVLLVHFWLIIALFHVIV